MIWLFLIVLILVLVYIIMYRIKQNRELTEEGKIIKREGAFVDEISVFKVQDVSFDELQEAVDKLDYDETNVTRRIVHKDEQYIEFQSSGQNLIGGWIAIIETVDSEDKKDTYRFYFSDYRTYNNTPPYITMNVMLTLVEKMFLELDHEATVKTERIKRETKADFF